MAMRLGCGEAGGLLVLDHIWSPTSPLRGAGSNCTYHCVMPLRGDSGPGSRGAGQGPVPALDGGLPTLTPLTYVSVAPFPT